MKWYTNIGITVIALAIVSIGTCTITTVRSDHEEQLLIKQTQNSYKEKITNNELCCKTNEKTINKLTTCFEVINTKLDNLKTSLDKIEQQR